ncbi:MAG: S8 family serine peptidase [Bryobacteraceae bacterium]
MKKIAALFIATAILCSAGPGKKKLSAELKGGGVNGLVQAIVQWEPEAGSDSAQKITALGGTVISEFPAVHSGVYLVPASALDALDSDGDVKFVSVDRKLHKKSAVVAPAVMPSTINAPAAWNAGYNGNGIGVAVLDSGINQDDNLGSYTHEPVYTEDFTVNLIAQPGGKTPSKPASYGVDWYGHGQHVAGIIASNGKISNCSSCTQVFAGVAPGVNLVNLKVLDVNGEGSDSYVIAAINRAISLKSTYNIRVMNLSLGRPVFESYQQDPLCQAVEAAWKAGILVVVSAGNNGRDNTYGNDGYGTIEAPGNDPYVLTVGAMRDMGTPTRSDDLLASYSSKGPSSIDHVVKPDLVAPGNQIVSLLAQNGTLALSDPQNVAPMGQYQYPAPKLGTIPIQPTYDPSSRNQPPGVKIAGGYSQKYFILNGTSMAAAVVSGAAADLIQAAPSLTPDQVKMLLMRTASKTFPTVSTVTDSTTGQTYTSYYDVFSVGAGYLDLAAALTAVTQVPAGLSAISPTATYDSVTGSVSLSFDATSVFSDKAMWGAGTLASNKAMWGAGTLASTKAMWGASGVWGSSVVDSNKAMWGASAVWGAATERADKALWGANAVWTNKALWGASEMTTPQSVMINGEK